MEFDYKEYLLLQAIFSKLVTRYIVKESYIGVKPLSDIIKDLVLSEKKNY